jgi:hypothetical protein
MAIDGMGLADQQSTATVLDKIRHGAGRAYSTQVVGNRTLVVPQTTGEMLILSIDLDGVRSEASVDRALYDAVGSKDRVCVTYQRRRITGAVQVVAVTH